MPFTLEALLKEGSIQFHQSSPTFLQAFDIQTDLLAFENEFQRLLQEHFRESDDFSLPSEVIAQRIASELLNFDQGTSPKRPRRWIDSDDENENDEKTELEKSRLKRQCGKGRAVVKLLRYDCFVATIPYFTYISEDWIKSVIVVLGSPYHFAFVGVNMLDL